MSVSNPKSKDVAYLFVLSQISNCQSLGRKNKHGILKTDRISIATDKNITEIIKYCVFTITTMITIIITITITITIAITIITITLTYTIITDSISDIIITTCIIIFIIIMLHYLYLPLLLFYPLVAFRHALL